MSKSQISNTENIKSSILSSFCCCKTKSTFIFFIFGLHAELVVLEYQFSVHLPPKLNRNKNVESEIQYFLGVVKKVESSLIRWEYFFNIGVKTNLRVKFSICKCEFSNFESRINYLPIKKLWPLWDPLHFAHGEPVSISAKIMQKPGSHLLKSVLTYTNSQWNYDIKLFGSVWYDNWY